MVLYLLLKAEVRLKGYYMKPQSLSGMGRVHWSYRLPLLWTTVGGELWKAQARSVLSHQPQLLQDESRGMMVETWGVCSFRGIDNSIFLTVMLCLLFYFWLSGRAVCTYMETCFPFPAIHWNTEMFALSLLLWYGFAFLSSYILKPPATKGICSKWASYFYFTSVSLLSVPCIALLFPPCRRLGTDLRRLKWTFRPLAHFKIEA